MAATLPLLCSIAYHFTATAFLQPAVAPASQTITVVAQNHPGEMTVGQQKPVGGFAKLLTFAPSTEARFYLRILVCKILAQKLSLLRAHFCSGDGRRL
jgi:hypothetical protein